MATAWSSTSTLTRRSGGKTRARWLRSDRWRSERARARPLVLRELLDLLARHRLAAREEALHLPLGGVVGEDQLLGAAAVGDVGDPVVEVGRAAVGDGHPAHAHPATTLDLREWLPAFHRVSPSRLALSDRAGRNRPRNNRAGGIGVQHDRDHTTPP